MVIITLFNGLNAYLLDGEWYHVADRDSEVAPVDVEFEMYFWKKVNPLHLPVWLACYMSNK
jgi:hypothetical protein